MVEEDIGQCCACWRTGQALTVKQIPLVGEGREGVKYLGLVVGEVLLPPSARQEASVLPNKGERKSNRRKWKLANAE